MFADELRLATLRLPLGPGGWIRWALESGRFKIEPGAYDGPDGAVCPVVAAATTAGVWHDGSLLPGHPEWGTPEQPSPEIVDFAAYFDLCAEGLGIEPTLAVVLDALRPITIRGLAGAGRSVST